VGRGMAIGDIYNDGRIDAVVTTNGGQAYVLRNETETANHWLTLRLVGHTSNRDGIGSVVKVVTGSGSQKQPQWVTVTTAGGYLSASDPRAHFGLGPAARVESIEIAWPSGITQTLKDVAADQILVVEEEAPQGHASQGRAPRDGTAATHP
jgi:enediyne biosynthesis protein E4